VVATPIAPEVSLTATRLPSCADTDRTAIAISQAAISGIATMGERPDRMAMEMSTRFFDLGKAQSLDPATAAARRPDCLFLCWNTLGVSELRANSSGMAAIALLTPLCLAQ
jgi:hypothetical protein